jgi:hypothetical protein
VARKWTGTPSTGSATVSSRTRRGDHSQSAARAAKLEKEIAYNYPDGPKRF